MNSAVTAVLFTSNTGFTAKYARLLAQASGIPAYDMSEKKELPPWGASVLYLGWLCAGTIKGFSSARKRYQIQAVCAVGMAPAESGQSEKLSGSNHLGNTPLFYLRGGFAPEKLTGVLKVMMGFMARAVAKAPAETEADREQQAALVSGGNWVSTEALEPVLAWLEKRA